MSSTHISLPEPNKSHLATEEETDPLEVERRVGLLMFGLCVTIAATTLVGGVYSLFALFRMRRKTSLCLIVASMSVDDLLSVVPLSLFMLLQWDNIGEVSGTLCTLSGLLYVFQGVSSNMKASLIAAYTFYVTKRSGVLKSVRRPLKVIWAIAAVWMVSLVVSLLPLCGWGTFTHASLGCFPESDGFYSVLLFSLYSVCFCALLFFFLPLTYQLLCSREPQRTLFYPRYFEISRGPMSGSAPLCEFPSCSRDSLNKSFNTYNQLNSVSFVTGSELQGDAGTCGTLAPLQGQDDAIGDSPVLFAQKRFSMILAVVRVILWMPLMTLVLVRRAVHVSSSLETLSFFLTLLAPAVTPLFALSERWNHMPCGCFIHCKRDPMEEPTVMKRRFEFTLSFKKDYRIYKLSPAANSQQTPSTQKPAYHNLFGCHFPDNRLHVLDSGGLPRLGADFDFSTTPPVDSSSHADLLLERAGGGEALADCVPLPQEDHGGDDSLRRAPSFPSLCGHHEEQEQSITDTSSVFEESERRLSQGECRQIELTDWEWCRSKSERTPRQRSTGGLSIPLCAFQGTVSLQAPTGKTLSLSTYEISSDGLKISPNNAKKVEVYRSKSVGHEPRADDAASGEQAGDVSTDEAGNGAELGMGPGMTVGIGSGVGDTNVKIHLEVLEICDNEEAMDSVSIISNISQSSTHARSPSLRYSRRENRFVSCDLAETASYSLLIPSGGNPEADSINISIPDTVEAHRQNSRRQTQESSGYHEEIQLLNEAYMKKQDGSKED